MPTDLLRETRISLTQLARELDVSLSTVWRWTLRGIRGHRLESLSLGGRRYTTREALERYLAAINGEPVTAGQIPRQREAAIARAERELREAGV